MQKISKKKSFSLLTVTPNKANPALKNKELQEGDNCNTCFYHKQHFIRNSILRLQEILSNNSATSQPRHLKNIETKLIKKKRIEKKETNK